MNRKALTIAAGAALLGMGQPAAAQYMPHLDPNLYILTTMMMNNGEVGCAMSPPYAPAPVSGTQ